MNDLLIPKRLVELKKGGPPETLDFPLQIRAEDVKEDGQFKGYASIFGGEPDSYGDIIEKGAFHETLQKDGRNGNGIAMLWQHAPEFPIGGWDKLVEDEHGLAVEGWVDKTVQPLGIPVYQMVRKGAVRGLSIGFRALRWEKIEEGNTGNRLLKEIELWEISLVTFPAMVKAQVMTVKDIEGAKTPRELEKALREAGLTNTAAKYMVSMCRQKLTWREAAAVDSVSLLAELRKANLALELFKHNL